MSIYKVKIFWVGHRNLAHLPLFFGHWLVSSKYKWKKVQIFVAFSEYMNFKTDENNWQSHYFCELFFFSQMIAAVSKFCVLWKDFVDKLRPVRGLHSCFFCCFWHLNYLGRAWTNTWQNSEGEKIKHSLGWGKILVCPWRSSRFASDPYSFYCHTHVLCRPKIHK